MTSAIDGASAAARSRCRFQAALVSRALESADWNVAATARTLDLTRAHVYNLINAFGLSRRAAE